MAQQVGATPRAGAPQHGTDPAGPAPPTVRRRRGLPGSRAVVGGFLVAVAAVGLFAAASSAGRGPVHSYVVAGRDLAAGTRLDASDLALAPMDLPGGLRVRAFERADVLVGATLLAPLGAGELVQSSAVVARSGDAASRELTFTLELGRVGPGVKHGERVDLLSTYGTGNDAMTVVVVHQALLVAVERPRTGAGDIGPATVTVAVDDATDTMALAHAVQLGNITLVRATGAPPLVGVPPTYRVARG